MLGFFAYSVIANPVEHIEDSNGERDTSIVTITDEEIINHSYGSRGMTRSESNFNIAGWKIGGVRFHSKKFTGVDPLLQQNIIFSTEICLNIYNYNIESGNFRLYVVNDDKIIDIIKPSKETSHYYENIKGTFTVIAVGESANFEFEMNSSEYNEYDHFGYDD